MHHAIRPVVLGILVLAATGAAIVAHAQPYPNKAIRLILPVAPGGAGDVYARPLAQKLTETFGQPVVIDHRPGATSTIGLALAAKSPPDGYTLVWGSTSFQVRRAGAVALAFFNKTANEGIIVWTCN